MAEAPSLGEIERQDIGELLEPHRRELQAHCYRMLGSLLEAEDAVQEAMLRAWRRRETFEGRAPLRAWLYKIATNVCLDMLAKRPRRSLPVARQGSAGRDDPIPPALTEPVWLEPYRDDLLASEAQGPEARVSTRESVTLAFITALHSLSPRQRAVLLLRDVQDWHAHEAANMLGVSVPALKSALHRARTALASCYRAERVDEAGTPALDDERRRLLERYVRAWEAADVDGLTDLLRDDARFSMPPIPVWFQGREDIRALVSRTVFSGPAAGCWRLRPTRANSRPAFGLYRSTGGSGPHTAYGIQVASIEQGLISDMTTLINAEILPKFGLPATL